MSNTVSSLKNNTNICLTSKASWLLVCLLVLADPISAVAQAQSVSCEIQETANVGSGRRSDSETFATMSAITAVSVVRVDSRRSCPVTSYRFTDNILSTDAGCSADFLVTGLEVGCTPSSGTTSNAIAQTPLFLSESTDPNVMFVLDDSGSMQFEMMPDSLTSVTSWGVYYLYPRADGVYGGSDYSNFVVTFKDSDSYNARARSPQLNTIYYNPSITYRPWKKADGNPYPQANTKCALHNPTRSGTGAAYCRDLTVENHQYNDNYWFYADNTWKFEDQPFWPAVYFWHNGGDSTLRSSYTRVEIRPTVLTYSGHGRTDRDDCAEAVNGSCTYAEELQNFANWYTYYRSRVLTARAGVGFAFAQQGSGMRLGFGAINKSSGSVDGVDTPVIIDGVRRFTGDARQNFFDKLYTHTIPAAGTPLRSALDAAGQYFMRSDNRGPWGESPGTASTTAQLACRRCYTVLTTDGYWNGNAASTSEAQENNDGTSGSAIANNRPEGGSYTYSVTDSANAPFKDSYSNTLADVAMYYWKNDLRAGAGGLSNVIGPVAGNPAFWQHMTTFGVGLGVTGAIDPEDAFAAIDSHASIDWPNPTSGTAVSEKVDDLLHAAVNSRGGFFSASDPDTLTNELSAVLQAIVEENRSSSSSIAANSTRLDEGTYIYQASFNGIDWSGQIQAFQPRSGVGVPLAEVGQINKDDPRWDTDNAETFAAPSTRNIFTARGVTGALINGTNAGVAFLWSSLSTAQQALLQPADTNGSARLDWLRGYRTGEGSTFRMREKLLGDIINSDPFFVGNTEDYRYRNLAGTEGSSYATFLTAAVAEGGKGGRKNMLYVGANDGMLHGFDAQTGQEIFGFIPAGVFANLHLLTSPEYQHRYYVDGSPRAGDAYIGGQWKTVLVGATGAGGRSVFALNITNPDSIGASSVLWEFSTDGDDTDKLGVAMSQPSIARVKAGDDWVAIFGNGYESGDTVKLMVLDLSDGHLIKAIDTGISGDGNGLATPIPVDVNNDRITDYVYAGDLKGNLWRFDLTSNSDSGWVATKLFAAVDAAGDPQPITSRPAVGLHPDGGLLVYFGTGKYFQESDNVVEADPQVQTFYGIRDLNGAEVERDQLIAQEIIFEGFGSLNPGETAFQVRAVTNSTSSAPAYGWYLNLVPPSGTAEGERLVSTPVVRFGRIIFTTIIPTNDPCGYGGKSWLMELDAVTGGRLEYSAFDANNDGKIDDNDLIEVDGVRISASGKFSDEMNKTPGIVSAGGDIEYKYTSGSSGTIGVTREKGGGSGFGRQSWRQMQ